MKIEVQVLTALALSQSTIVDNNFTSLLRMIPDNINENTMKMRTIFMLYFINFMRDFTRDTVLLSVLE